MASQALTVTDWKAAFRRSLRRAGQIAGAAVLTLGTLFLALSLASYAQTDPSQSTAAATLAESLRAVCDQALPEIPRSVPAFWKRIGRRAPAPGP